MSEEHESHTESRIFVAYGLIGLFSVVLAISLVISYHIDPREIRHRRPIADDENSVPLDPSSKTNLREGDIGFSYSENLGNKKLSMVLSFLVGVHCLVFLVILMCFSRYLSIYAVLRGISKDRSIVLVSTFYSSFTFSRFISIFPASKLRPKVFWIFTDLALLTTSLIFFFAGSRSESTLHVSSVLLGAACAPVYAAGTSFLVSRVHSLTHSHMSVLKFMSNCGGLVPPFAIGPLIETSPEIFPKVVLASTLLLVAIMALVILFEGWPRGERIIEAVINTSLPCSATKQAMGQFYSIFRKTNLESF